MINADSTPTTAKQITGSSQLEVCTGRDFNSVKTSPGTANTLSRRAGNDMVGVVATCGSNSGNGGGCSITTVIGFDPGEPGKGCQRETELSSKSRSTGSLPVTSRTIKT